MASDDESTRSATKGLLPRFSLASIDELGDESAPQDVVRVLHTARLAPLLGTDEGAAAQTGTDTHRATIHDGEFSHPWVDTIELEIDFEGEPEKESSPRRPAVAVPSVAYKAPVPAGGPSVPAYARARGRGAALDADEKQLQSENSFGALLELYRLRIEDVDAPLAKAELLHKLASVYEVHFNQPEPAFRALLKAFDLNPSDAEIVSSLERVAKAAGRIVEIADHAKKMLSASDLERQTLLLGHLVYWFERVLGRSDESLPFVLELERLDKAHPVSLRRAALTAAANGDTKTQRELLRRALDSTVRQDEKAHLYVALASAHAGTPEALKYYELAVANDGSSIVALQGIERIGSEQGLHGQVEWSLERQAEVALTSAERVDALVKLAQLHESKYLKRERAAEILELVVAKEPSHPLALTALARCYHALRDWTQLAKVVRLRAANTYDKEAKTELLELAAEVFESKLGELASAIAVHHELLALNPRHRRSLADLARLYEKLGDWANVAVWKSRVAELAPTARQTSLLLIQLGDFLSVPGRDALAARAPYERALIVDPTNAAVWEALQRLAVADGDPHRIAKCLEQRAKHVDGPRQRAAIFVELAGVHRQTGDDRAAREAYEEAIKADPTHELAAAFMLDVYSREERWGEAAPLCELLVHAAKRDDDIGALFTRLRLATRIAAALGDANHAMTYALAALDIMAQDPGAIADMLAVCSQCRDQAHVVDRAKDALTLIAAGSTPIPSDVLIGLARMQRRAGEVNAAARTLERVLELEPSLTGLRSELADVYLAEGDYPRCCKLRVDLARDAASVDERFRLLVEVGEIWAQQAYELETAAGVFEEARQIKPLDPPLLQTLVSLYGELKWWREMENALESLAQTQDTAEKKAGSLFALANLVEETSRDLLRVAELFDGVLDIDHRRLDAFERLVRALTEAKDWQGLERAYRKMIARTAHGSEPNPSLNFALHQQLGLIYRDRLDDVARAYEALNIAAHSEPEDAGVRTIVTELLVVTDNLDNAVARLRELIDRTPHDADLYSEIYDLFLRQRAFDKAWCAINVLAQMREPSAEQRRFHADYAPVPLAEIPGQVVEDAWRSHVLHRDLDPVLTTLFARLAPVVARIRYGQLQREQLVHSVERPFTGQHSRRYDSIRKAFVDAAEVLCMSPPALLLGDPNSSLMFTASRAPIGALNVSVPALEAHADTMVYVIGKRLAERRSELLAQALFTDASDLETWLASAGRLSRKEKASDAQTRALDASLDVALTPYEREGLHEVLTQARAVGTTRDIKRWSRAADLSSTRAAVLLCGDVGPARKAILAEVSATRDGAALERVGEIYKLATSDLYADLRVAIGVAVRE